MCSIMHDVTGALMNPALIKNKLGQFSHKSVFCFPMDALYRVFVNKT